MPDELDIKDDREEVPEEGGDDEVSLFLYYQKASSGRLDRKAQTKCPADHCTSYRKR